MKNSDIITTRFVSFDARDCVAKSKSYGLMATGKTEQDAVSKLECAIEEHEKEAGRIMNEACNESN